MTTARTSDLWWKNAVVYCLDVETFLDWDGDGRGDFQGLTERVDYLAGMGVSCIWLMPFYPSPDKNDGYDISDYYALNPRLGSLGDFVAFMRTARDRGMRVIVDLVVNHTSDQHPWFRASRSSRDNAFRDFYVWVDKPPRQKKADLVFPDAEDGIWTYDEKTDQWYLHHFYSHQPDLNISNPVVRDEIAKLVGFWLELGVDGFRVDAVPFLIETGDVSLDPHTILRNLRSFISRRRGDSMMLGEVNLPYGELRQFFGGAGGDELHMNFDFILMQRMYLALARQDATPIREALSARPALAEGSQWAVFVRNHDELTLDKLSDGERQEVFEAFGPEPSMQLFGRGLRRRLPPMLDGDGARVRLVYSLLLPLPGTPVLFYGEEIGMGENLDVPGRLSVRTPMQRTDERNGGFSPAPPSRLTRPVAHGRYGPLAVNVAAQRRDPDSLLNWFERVIRRRRETPEFGWGACAVLDTAGDDAVLAHRCDWEEGAVVAVHNLSPEPRHVRVRLGDGKAFDRVIDLLASAEPQPLNGDMLEMKMDGHGFQWVRLQRKEGRTVP